MRHCLNATFALLVAAPAAAEISFGPETVIEAAAGIADIVLADLDGDADLDIVLLEGQFGFPSVAFLEVLLNEGDGTFAAPETTNLGTFGGLEFFVDELAAGDLDGDDDLDLAFVGSIAPLTLLFNEGGGRLGAPLESGLVADAGGGHALLDLGDLDGDGDADVVLGKPGRIAFTEGPAQFTVVDFPSFSSDEQLAVVDLSGDEVPDIAYGGQVHVNDGSGAFAPAGTFLAAGAFECAYRALDGDDAIDVACARIVPSEVRVALNNGDAIFTDEVALPASFPRAIASGDLDGDGRADLAVRHDTAVSFFAGRGDGTFQGAQMRPTPLGREIAVGELSGDGLDDVVIGVGTTVFDGPAAVIVLIAQPESPPGDLDGDGLVGVADLLVLLAAWGNCPGPCPPACGADLDGDCAVGVVDLLVLLANWTV